MYCKNCGNKIEENTRYCTRCGYDNNKINNIYNENDKASVGLNIVGFIWPLIGLILFICMNNNTPKKAKSIGKWSLIGFTVKIIIYLLCIGLIFVIAFFFDEEELEFNEFDNYSERYDYESENDIDDFVSAIDYYVLLASKEFYKDAYSDRELTEKCYSIKELGKDNYYDGSIQIELKDEELKITIWFTDYYYVVNGIDYDNYKVKDIEKGSKVNSACKNIGNDNSL